MEHNFIVDRSVHYLEQYGITYYSRIAHQIIIQFAWFICFHLNCASQQLSTSPHFCCWRKVLQLVFALLLFH